MNVHSLKEYIIDNDELIELLLEKAGFHNINGNFSHGTEYRCSWDEDGNPTAIRVYKDTLKSTYFKTGLDGDLITLIQEKLGYGFSKTLKFISNTIDFIDEEIEYEDAFSGLFKELESLQDYGEYIELTTHDESILDNYMLMPSKMFLDDGVGYQAQVDFKIGYDIESDRIIVPWRSLSGELIGIMGRLNKDAIEAWESKWLPLKGLNFPKSKTLFAYSENYKDIQQHGMVFLFESEKSPMKLRSQGCNLGLALGGNKINDYQASNINSLFPNMIVVGLDEGLDEDQSVEIVEKLKIDTYYENKVYYLYDDKGLFLPKGSKMSPADLPLSDLKSMMKQCMRTI